MGLFGKNRKKIGELLIQNGLATKADIEEALRIQKDIWETKKMQKNLGEILHDKGIVSVEDVHRVLKMQQGENFFLKQIIYSIFHSGQPK